MIREADATAPLLFAECPPTVALLGYVIELFGLPALPRRAGRTVVLSAGGVASHAVVSNTIRSCPNTRPASIDAP